MDVLCLLLQSNCLNHQLHNGMSLLLHASTASSLGFHFMAAETFAINYFLFLGFFKLKESFIQNWVLL